MIETCLKQEHLDLRKGFPGGSDSKESPCNAGDLGSILDGEDPLEKGMATHSVILALRIPWTEEPGGLQSMGSQTDMTERLTLSGSSPLLTYREVSDRKIHLASDTSFPSLDLGCAPVSPLSSRLEHPPTH